MIKVLLWDKIFVMKQVLSKFLIVKTILYTIWFGLLWYGMFFRTQSIQPSSSDINISDMNQVCIADHCFDIEIADNDVSRQQWLMYRETLPSQSGMLFVFDREQKYPFWMKNTLIPLDMLWINSGGYIVDIQTAIPCISDPCPTYDPKSDSLYVLEINAGLSQLLWIQTWAITQFKKK